MVLVTLGHLPKHTLTSTVVSGLSHCHTTGRELIFSPAKTEVAPTTLSSNQAPTKPEPKSRTPEGSQHLDRGLLDQNQAKRQAKLPLQKLKSSFSTILGCLHGSTTPSYQHWEQSPWDGRQKCIIPQQAHKTLSDHAGYTLTFAR